MSTAAVLSTPLEVETLAGRVSVAPADVIQMALGLPGFERCRRYVLVAAPELAPFTCLQGLDDPQPSFITVDPRLVEPGYDVALSQAERARLGVTGGETLLWLAPVHVSDTRATVNLRAPIVVHPGRMVALQLLGADSPYTTAHPLPGE